MPSLYAYAKEHHLTVTGHPMELCHIDSYETNRESEYVIELALPVRSHPFAKPCSLYPNYPVQICQLPGRTIVLYHVNNTSSIVCSLTLIIQRIEGEDKNWEWRIYF